MEEKIKELELRVNILYTVLYTERLRSVNKLIENKVTDTAALSEELDRCLDCIEDELILNQFWKLINYVETFDWYLGAEYRCNLKSLTEVY